MGQVCFERAQNRVEPFDVADLQNETTSRGQLYQVGSMRSVVGDRFFDQHMFAFRKKGARSRVVGVSWRCHRSGIDHLNKFIE
jgi:hypothetical protein